MSKTTNKCSPEVRERAVRMVLDNEHQHESRWATTFSISSRVGCAAQTLELENRRHFANDRLAAVEKPLRGSLPRAARVHNSPLRTSADQGVPQSVHPVRTLKQARLLLPIRRERFYQFPEIQRSSLASNQSFLEA